MEETILRIGNEGSVNGLNQLQFANKAPNRMVQFVNEQVVSDGRKLQSEQQTELRAKLVKAERMDRIASQGSQDDLIDRGMRVMEGVYAALRKSISSSIETMIDPMLEKLTEMEKLHEEAEADSDDKELLGREIEWMKTQIQTQTDAFMDFYGKFYGGFMNGIYDMYNQKTGGAFGSIVAAFMKERGLEGFDFLDLSAKGLGLDKLEGRSSDIKKKFDDALRLVDMYQETLEYAREERMSSKNGDREGANQAKAILKSYELDMLEKVLDTVENGNLEHAYAMLQSMGRTNGVIAQYRSPFIDVLV
jgi:hypothetical protein